MADFKDTSTLEYRVVGANDVARANQQILQSAKDAEKHTKTFGDTLRNFGRNIQWTGQRITFSLGLPLLGLGKTAIDTALSFDKAMTQARAAASEAGNVISDQVFEHMKDVIRTTAKDSVVSLDNIAGGLESFVKAGLDVDTALKSLQPTLKFATASNQDMGDSTLFATKLMRNFGDANHDIKKLLDITTIAVQKSTAEFPDFTHNIQMSMAFAKDAGQSYEQLAAATALLTDKGIPAANVGFQLRQAFSQMIKPTDQARNLMKQLNISFSDAKGTMKPLTQVVAELREKTAGMTEAQRNLVLQTLFNVRAGQAMRGLLQTSQEDYQKYIDIVSNAAGATDQMAQVVEDSKQGRWQKFINQLAVAKEELGERLLPVMERLIPIVIGILDWFNRLNPATQDWIIKIALAVVALGPFLIILGSTLETFGLLFKSVQGLVTIMGVGGGALVGVLGVAAVAFLLVRDAVKSYRQELDKANDANRELMENSKSAIKKVAELRAQGRNAEADRLQRIITQNNVPGGHQGMVVPRFQTGGIIPGSSALRDRTPILAEPGEGIMSRQAMENFLRTGQAKSGGSNVTFNINVGTMIATPGEQREFARRIKSLLFEDSVRLAGVR